MRAQDVAGRPRLFRAASWRLVLFLLIFPVLRAEIEFSGYFLAGTDARFALTDLEARHASGWLKIGQSFAGYTVAGFDRKAETIRLEHDGQVTDVPLRAAKVKEGKATITGMVQLRHEQIDGVQAALFLGEEATFPLKDGVTLRLLAEARSDGTILYRSRFELRTPDGSIDTMNAPDVVARPGSRFGVRIGDVGYDFTP